MLTNVLRGAWLSVALVNLIAASAALSAEPDSVVDIGTRRELFADDLLVAKTAGDVTQFVHEPEPKEVALVTGEPWEGNTCAYYSIFQDGDIYRMYYRGSHANAQLKGTHPEVTCYAFSKDGVHWTKPKLGLHDWNGSKDNNIILKGLGAHCFVAFKDENPNCKPEAKYKGISRGGKPYKHGLYVFQSPDGIRWSPIKEQPVITKGAFDSQNLAFWDPHTGKYADYHRIFINGVRSIMTCESDDFVNWTEPKLLKFPGAPNQHLYTNAVRPYARAPHIRIGFPTRYIPKGSKVEPVFMASRDGLTFKRYPKPVIPRSAPKDRDGNRSNYMANGLLSLPGDDKSLSVYGTEAYYAGPDSRLRRFAYRVDGFVSMRAGEQGGSVTTPPLKFGGGKLELNYAAKNGSVEVELLDETGEPIPGFTRAQCRKLTGDEIAASVGWNSDRPLQKQVGRAVRLRFHLRNADLFSFRFHE